MRKLVVHLAIACTTFAFSASLTNIWRSLTQAEVAPVETFQLHDLPTLSDEPELLDIFSQYAAAETRHDQAFFERVETEDFILSVGEGETLTRTEDIRAMNNSPTDIIYMLDVEEIDLHGTTATVISTVTATQQGKSDSWRTVDVCVKRDGRWQIRSTTNIE